MAKTKTKTAPATKTKAVAKPRAAKEKAGKNPTANVQEPAQPVAQQPQAVEQPPAPPASQPETAQAPQGQAQAPKKAPVPRTSEIALPANVTLHVAYTGARGRRVRHFTKQSQANAFYRRRIRKQQDPEFVPEGTVVEPPALDKFGCRLGTQAAQINACMTYEAQTAEAIAEKTGLALSRVKSHLKGFVAKGYFTQRDDGVCINPKREE